MGSTRILGRAYAFHILNDVAEKELTFTWLLRNLGISRGALATTLEDLVVGNLVRRRKYGRFVYYSITDKGRQMLHNYLVTPTFLEEKVLQTIYDRLAERFPIDRGLSKKEIEERLRPRVRQFVEMLAGDLMVEFEKRRMMRKPSTKAEMFGKGNLPPELEHVADVSTIKLLRKEVKRVQTLKEFECPQPQRSKALTDGKDAIYMGCKTTKIFCRLTCPCKMPRIENLRFFSSAKEAIAHKYRACKICKPL